MLTEQEEIRRAKIKKIAEKTNPYPEKYDVTHELCDARNLPDGEANVSVAGRIVSLRNLGKLTFVKISDILGSLQISIKQDSLGEEAYRFFTEIIDIGDFIGANGEMFTTHTGEKTLRAEKWTFLGKALKPLPEKFHGLTDIEACYRQRYLDLISNQETRDKLLLRSNLIKNLREFLFARNYIEIETPILCNKASGALARPFVTHHNALDIDVFLRISPETYLKRAVVGGFTKVFEVARNFRNEGIDTRHLQDFTMVEGYGAYLNYKDNMKLCQQLICYIIEKSLGTTKINIYGTEVDLSGEWPVVSFRELIEKDCGIDIEAFGGDAKKLLAEIENKKIPLEFDGDISKVGFGTVVDYLYKKVSRPQIVRPTFLTEHPISLSPLARANDADKNKTDRFQILINGTEVCNAYSELVDPIEQKKRLDEQAALRSKGDTEAMMSDDDYVSAMEYGMPPISGWGLGIDTFTTMITSSANIRDIVMFPLMKPEERKKEMEVKQSKSEDEALMKNFNIKLNYADALALLKNYNKEPFHLVHAETVEGVMRQFAEKLGFNKTEADFWAIAGLLHDIDFEQHPNEHCIKAKEILKEHKYPEELIRAVCSHGYKLVTDVEPVHIMEKVLYAVDELTGLIGAAVRLRPSKSVKDLELSSIKKKFKDLKFAAGCDREVITRGAEMLGWDLDRLITETIEAMKQIEK